MADEAVAGEAAADGLDVDDGTGRDRTRGEDAHAELRKVDGTDLGGPIRAVAGVPAEGVGIPVGVPLFAALVDQHG
jgi:hypothetical protein